MSAIGATSAWRPTVAALAAAAAVAGLVACGAQKPMMRESQPPPTDAATEGPVALLGARPDEVRQQIEELDRLIAADRDVLGTEAPDAMAASAMSDTPPAAAQQVCERSPRATCTDVCKLGDSICKNATSICDLAKQLPGDAWAAGKCDAGKASCKTASARCCDC